MGTLGPTDGELARHGYATLLTNSSYVRMLASDLISGTGEVLYWIALIVFLDRQEGAEGLIAAAVVVRLSPRVLFGAAAGVVADRFDRRQLMITLDGARGVAMLLLAGVVATDGSPHVALVLVFVTCAISTPYRPAQQSGYPRLVGERDLAAANALTSTLGQFTSLIGPLLGALCLALGEPAWSFVANAATYFVSVLLLSRVAGLSGPRRPRRRSSAGLGSEMASGLRAVHEQVGVRSIVGLVGSVMVLRGAELVLHIQVATTLLGLGPAGYGVICAAMGGGALLAGPFTSRIAAVANPGRWLLGSVLVSSASLALLAIAGHMLIAVVVLVVEGVSVVTFEVLAITLIQRVCRREVLGRVLGIQGMISGLGKLLGSLVAPGLVGIVGLRVTLVGIAALTVGLALFFGSQAASSLTEAAARRNLTRPFTDVFGRLGLFEGANLPALEAMALDTAVMAVEPGEVLIHEGDPADDLYVIRSGTVIIDRNGMWVGRCDADDWVGEVGLLSGSPRNATAIAATAGEVWRIPGESFLRAVTSRVSVDAEARQDDSGVQRVR